MYEERARRSAESVERQSAIAASRARAEEEGSMMAVAMAVLSGMIVVAMVALGWWVLGSDDYAQCASVVSLFAARGIKLVPCIAGEGVPCAMCSTYVAIDGVPDDDMPSGEATCARCVDEALSAARLEVARLVVLATDPMAMVIVGEEELSEAREYVTHLEEIIGKADKCSPPLPATPWIEVNGVKVRLATYADGSGTPFVRVEAENGELRGENVGEYYPEPAEIAPPGEVNDSGSPMQCPACGEADPFQCECESVLFSTPLPVGGDRHSLMRSYAYDHAPSGEEAYRLDSLYEGIS